MIGVVTLLFIAHDVIDNEARKEHTGKASDFRHDSQCGLLGQCKGHFLTSFEIP